MQRYAWPGRATVAGLVPAVRRQTAARTALLQAADREDPQLTVRRAADEVAPPNGQALFKPDREGEGAGPG